ncbi:unnamed protein product [Cochlearia groenlandica]
METLIVEEEEHRNQYYEKKKKKKKKKASSKAAFRQINCRAFDSGVGLLPLPNRTTITKVSLDSMPYVQSPPSPKSVLPVFNDRTRPTYSNSPPPASVPIPKFYLEQKKTVSSSFNAREVARSAPVSLATSYVDKPFRSSSSNASATMTLRRMLNLENVDE